MLESESNEPATAPIASPDAPPRLSLESGPQTLQELQALQAKIQEQMMVLQKGQSLNSIAASGGVLKSGMIYLPYIFNRGVSSNSAKT
jgi:hypothetical protein